MNIKYLPDLQMIDIMLTLEKQDNEQTKLDDHPNIFIKDNEGGKLSMTFTLLLIRDEDMLKHQCQSCGHLWNCENCSDLPEVKIEHDMLCRNCKRE